MVYSREQLIDILWGPDAEIEERTVDVEVGRLRKALTLGRAPDPIRSVRGRGYKLSEFAEQDYAAWLLDPNKIHLRSKHPSRRGERGTS